MKADQSTLTEADLLLDGAPLETAEPQQASPLSSTAHIPHSQSSAGASGSSSTSDLVQRLSASDFPAALMNPQLTSPVSKSSETAASISPAGSIFSPPPTSQMLPADFTLSSPQATSFSDASTEIQEGPAHARSSSVGQYASRPAVSQPPADPALRVPRSRGDVSPLKATREFLHRQQQQLLLWEQQRRQRQAGDMYAPTAFPSNAVTSEKPAAFLNAQKSRILGANRALDEDETVEDDEETEDELDGAPSALQVKEHIRPGDSVAQGFFDLPN